MDSGADGELKFSVSSRDGLDFRELITGINPKPPTTSDGRSVTGKSIPTLGSSRSARAGTNFSPEVGTAAPMIGNVTDDTREWGRVSVGRQGRRGSAASVRMFENVRTVTILCGTATHPTRRDGGNAESPRGESVKPRNDQRRGKPTKSERCTCTGSSMSCWDTGRRGMDLPTAPVGLRLQRMSRCSEVRRGTQRRVRIADPVVFGHLHTQDLSRLGFGRHHRKDGVGSG